MTKTRQLVPILLNGRLVHMFLEDGEPTISMEIPMRHYLLHSKLNATWEPRYILTIFNRETKTWPDLGVRSRENVTETFYTCTNLQITFENESIPVIQ